MSNKRDSKGRFVSKKSTTKGFKGFSPGMVCRGGKQYAENAFFTEPSASLCGPGMHFCEYPLNVFAYYPPVDDSGAVNVFAGVEASGEVRTDGDKSSSTELKIGAKIDFAGLGKAAVEFILNRVKNSKKESNTGDQSAATNTGDRSAAPEIPPVLGSRIRGRTRRWQEMRRAESWRFDRARAASTS